MTATTLPTDPVTGSAQRTVRRLIVYTLLFVLVTIGASGLSGLLARLLESGTPLAVGGNAGLALSLAFTLIGGPLAAVLWWVVWRRLTDDSERSSLAWGLYLALMYTVSLIVATSALVGTLSLLVSGRWDPGDLSVGAVWALVWVWHRWMWRHPVRHPIRLATVPAVAGTVYGLIIGIGGGVTALGSLLDTAIRRASEQAIAGTTWWQAPLESLIWAVAGGAIWSWHWFRDDARRLETGLARVALVVIGVLAAGFVMLAGLGTALFVLLRLAFDPSDPMGEILRPLGTALAAASVGALVWVYHHRIASGRSDGTRRAGALVMSGLGLVAAASGIGVVINATLATLASPLAASDTRSLLLGGISALAVGGPVWWISWKPARQVGSTEIGSTGRRVYLIAVFGVSAVVALITLLVVGYLLFEFALDPTTTASLVDRVRAPLGLLVATGLVFGYHFALWRRDRSVIAAEGLAPARRIGRVILVTAGDAVALEQAVTDATGASVTVWRSLDEPGAEPGADPDAAAIAGALEGVAGKRVLVLAGPGNRVEVVRLAD
ncbi:hypothetical protein J7E25_00220 [Agromyces sp. ISL-38]|uniref:DUF5671 domain-containing protein n=1 Tax=Agromyces sp. ISL-38 TaxID=2819107 RepID=UPI001BE55E69|nr:DUF5671 domain-containing protein [Agromyces sp. ISL-38]MBT2497516.1 hypothetical protein [Agromyces sp. ISL-38]MBT2517384.1 hypothetical protein [Streptomyces sp. ISL-90]